LIALLNLAITFINFILGEIIMRNQRKLESELLAYKFLCLFVLGFGLGYWCGKMVGAL
jgi:hypothetical protein